MVWKQLTFPTKKLMQSTLDPWVNEVEKGYD